MLKENTMDVLLRIGMPAGIKGVAYICDALELFDTDPYYADGKICSLYGDIAKRHGTTASRVERAIRHAFEAALTRGDQKLVNKYLDVANTQNSNLLRSLYFRIQSEQRKKQQASPCSEGRCAIKEQIYQEALKETMGILYKEMELVLKERFGEAGGVVEYPAVFQAKYR